MATDFAIISLWNAFFLNLHTNLVPREVDLHTYLFSYMLACSITRLLVKQYLFTREPVEPLQPLGITVSLYVQYET